MSVGKELDKGLELVKLEEIPDGLIELLDELYEDADAQDKENFGWLYEAAELRLNELTEEEIAEE